MARHVFHSFHYDQDCTRVNQVRHIGFIEGNRSAHPNEWEQIMRTDAGVERWIEDQLYGRSCTIVLIGSFTASRPWVRYEIGRSWDLGKGVFGIHIHNLKDLDGYQSPKGPNPFSYVGNLGSVVPVYDPPYWDSKDVYAFIANHIEGWIDHAIELRNRYP